MASSNLLSLLIVMLFLCNLSWCGFRLWWFTWDLILMWTGICWCSRRMEGSSWLNKDSSSDRVEFELIDRFDKTSDEWVDIFSYVTVLLSKSDMERSRPSYWGIATIFGIVKLVVEIFSWHKLSCTHRLDLFGTAYSQKLHAYSTEHLSEQISFPTCRRCCQQERYICFAWSWIW